jgi:hypothetical protein
LIEDIFDISFVGTITNTLHEDQDLAEEAQADVKNPTIFAWKLTTNYRDVLLRCIVSGGMAMRAEREGKAARATCGLRRV